jgi:hypothetical protein
MSARFLWAIGIGAVGYLGVKFTNETVMDFGKTAPLLGGALGAVAGFYFGGR